MGKQFEIRGQETARIEKHGRTLIITKTAAPALVQAATRAWETDTEAWEPKAWKDHFLTLTVKTH